MKFICWCGTLGCSASCMFMTLSKLMDITLVCLPHIIANVIYMNFTCMAGLQYWIVLTLLFVHWMTFLVISNGILYYIPLAIPVVNSTPFCRHNQPKHYISMTLFLLKFQGRLQVFIRRLIPTQRLLQHWAITDGHFHQHLATILPEPPQIMKFDHKQLCDSSTHLLVWDYTMSKGCFFRVSSIYLDCNQDSLPV